ncbi:MAG TPA: hypothetical protein PLO37_06015 [Candidatus Hydrogenedentes bacterium]|nr:hypothetical protein [Candidatus Hydrogenedentota bacterium]HPG66385.1 hypothetical protein [Candidatus Hydrogenedentota bacterium]
MVYRGHIENGVAVLDEAADLKDGTPVRIEVADAGGQAGGRPLTERLASIIGKVEGLPEDAAENHDRYLYGAPEA